jgi:transcriptional regulator with XRE-family HTH domain
MAKMVVNMTDTQLPRARHQLKGRVYASGWKTLVDFAQEIGIHRVYLSKILGGHEFPSPSVQRKIASGLGLTVRELRELL